MEQDSSAPIKPVTPTPVTDGKSHSKSLIVGMAALAVVAVAGIVFGVIELVRASEKDGQITTLNQQVANCANAGGGVTEKIEVTCPDGTVTEVVSSKIDDALVQALVDPYLVDFGAFENVLNYDFDVNAKMKIAFDNIGARQIESMDANEWSVTVRYDDFDKKYKYLFGSDQEIEKRSYNSPYFMGLTYDREYFKAVLSGYGGTGGTMFSIIKGARYDGDKLLVDMYHDIARWCVTLDNEAKDYCIDAPHLDTENKIENLIKNFADRVPVYTMTFAKDGDHYILRDIKKQ